MKIKFLGMLLLAAASVTAMAQTTPAERKVVKATAKSNQARIKNGVETGELTKTERAKIAVDRQETRSDLKMAKADGDVTRPEKKELVKDQARVSKEIYRKKHNARARN